MFKGVSNILESTSIKNSSRSNSINFSTKIIKYRINS